LATSRCNGILETARHNGHNGLLPEPTCYGLATGKLVSWSLAFIRQQTVNHPSTNQARRGVTWLMETMQRITIKPNRHLYK